MATMNLSRKQRRYRHAWPVSGAGPVPTPSYTARSTGTCSVGSGSGSNSTRNSGGFGRCSGSESDSADEGGVSVGSGGGEDGGVAALHGLSGTRRASMSWRVRARGMAMPGGEKTIFRGRRQRRVRTSAVVVYFGDGASCDAFLVRERRGFEEDVGG